MFFWQINLNAYFDFIIELITKLEVAFLNPVFKILSFVPDYKLILKIKNELEKVGFGIASYKICSK